MRSKWLTLVAVLGLTVGACSSTTTTPSPSAAPPTAAATSAPATAAPATVTASIAPVATAPAIVYERIVVMANIIIDVIDINVRISIREIAASAAATPAAEVIVVADASDVYGADISRTDVT